MYFSYKDIALAIAGGLVGYLSKDGVPVDQLTNQLIQLTTPFDTEIEEEIQIGSDSETA